MTYSLGGLQVEIDRLREGNRRLREALFNLERYVALECFDEWLPDGHKKTFVLSKKLEEARAILEQTL